MAAYQVCKEIVTDVPFVVAGSDADLAACLLERIAESHATRVLVSGPQATYLRHHVGKEQLDQALSADWAVLSCTDPTYDLCNELLASFADAINRQPGQRHICFCPTSPDCLQEHFLRRLVGLSPLAVYLIGLHVTPAAFAQGFADLLGRTPMVLPAALEVLVSAEDNKLLIATQAAIKAALAADQPACGLLAEGVDLLEHIDKVRLGIEERTPDGGFRPRTTPQTREEYLASFEHLGLAYRCRCGQMNLFQSSSVDPERGLVVRCSACRAPVFVPPTIFDETRRVRPNWQAYLERRG